MTRAAAFKQADLTRALRAATAAGLKVASYKIDPAGEVVVILADAAANPQKNPLDRLLQP